MISLDEEINQEKEKKKEIFTPKSTVHSPALEQFEIELLNKVESVEMIRTHTIQECKFNYN